MLKSKELKLKKKQRKFELQENLRLIAQKRVEIQKEREFRKQEALESVFIEGHANYIPGAVRGILFPRVREQRIIGLRREFGMKHSVCNGYTLDLPDYNPLDDCIPLPNKRGVICYKPVVELSIDSSLFKGIIRCLISYDLPAGIDIQIGDDIETVEAPLQELLEIERCPEKHAFENEVDTVHSSADILPTVDLFYADAVLPKQVYKPTDAVLHNDSQRNGLVVKQTTLMGDR